MNRPLISGSAVVAVMALAGIVATLNWGTPQPVLTGGTSDKLAGVRIEEKAAENFNGLSNAMMECETQARTDMDTLYFLTIPLLSFANARWRAQSINELDNTILLRSDDALQGLRSGTLRLYPGWYDFRILDAATNTVYSWNPATGATKMSGLNASAITQFKLQIAIKTSSVKAQWSDSSFYRETGTCYSVNAILGRTE